jgi:hypothetical protein
MSSVAGSRGSRARSAANSQNSSTAISGNGREPRERNAHLHEPGARIRRHSRSLGLSPAGAPPRAAPRSRRRAATAAGGAQRRGRRPRSPRALRRRRRRAALEAVEDRDAIRRFVRGDGPKRRGPEKQAIHPPRPGDVRPGHAGTIGAAFLAKAVRPRGCSCGPPRARGSSARPRGGGRGPRLRRPAKRSLEGSRRSRARRRTASASPSRATKRSPRRGCC